MTRLHIKKGDTVKILSGDDKGKTGKVVRAFPSDGKVLVEGMNMVKKHERGKRQDQKGQIVERAMPMNASKVAKI
jgi:large subunit ribosomal protein L24